MIEAGRSMQPSTGQSPASLVENDSGTAHPQQRRVFGKDLPPRVPGGSATHPASSNSAGPSTGTRSAQEESSAASTAQSKSHQPDENEKGYVYALSGPQQASHAGKRGLGVYLRVYEYANFV